MAATYVHVTQEEFHKFMVYNFFVCLNAEQTTQELVYSFEWGNGDYVLKVYSSIVQGKGGRSVGADAIRTVLFVNTPSGMRPMWKGKRVHRTKNWRDNLQRRINEGLDRGCEGRDHLCKKCGAPIILREGSRGFFYGCIRYVDTKCSYTMSFE